MTYVNDTHPEVRPCWTVLRAYRLGFFAAVTLEADNVVLDMNGHWIRQSRRHHLRQRFFACVETAGQGVSRLRV